MQSSKEGMAQTQQKKVPAVNEDVHTPGEVTEMFRWLKDNMVTRTDLQVEMGKIYGEMAAMEARIDARMATKEDLKKLATKEDLAKLGQDLRDHTTRECGKVRGDLVAIAHRQDEKTNEFVRTAAKSGTISRVESTRLQAINPFFVPTD